MTADASDAWVRVSRTALRHNWEAVQRLVSSPETTSPQLIAVVKANAFGHGAPETARTFQAAGADFFAVTTLMEAIELRTAGITGRILVFLPPLPEQWEIITAYDLDATVCDQKGLQGLTRAAHAASKTVRVHLKIDTGMGRLGVLPSDALSLARPLAAEPSLHFAGIYTHFARALEKDAGEVHRPFAVFQQVTQHLQNEGIDVGLRHCANSAALVRFPEMRLDAARPGTILYGQYPSDAVPRTLDLQNTWTLQARIVSLRDLPSGASVGYGGEFRTARPSKLAVLPLGYADGFTVAPASATVGWRGIKTLLRNLRSPQVLVTVRDRRVPVVGRVAMQICMVDVTDVPGIDIGDVVTLPARRITTSARLPRVYDEQE